MRVLRATPQETRRDSRGGGGGKEEEEEVTRDTSTRYLNFPTLKLLFAGGKLANQALARPGRTGKTSQMVKQYSIGNSPTNNDNIIHNLG